MNADSKIKTPWGKADSVEQIAPGIVYCSTPSHGGFHLSTRRQADMPEALRLPEPWYEEDCEYARVVCAFPEAFSEKMREQALTSLITFSPDVYESWSGKEIPKGMSRMRDQRIFQQEHAEDFIVVANSSLNILPGIILSHAVNGADLDENGSPRIGRTGAANMMFLWEKNSPRPDGYGTEAGHVPITQNQLEEIGKTFRLLREQKPDMLIPVMEREGGKEGFVVLQCRHAGYIHCPNEPYRTTQYLSFSDDKREIELPERQWRSRDLAAIPIITHEGIFMQIGNEADIQEIAGRCDRAQHYASRFMVENVERGTCKDLSDENLRKSFADCVLPLKPKFYDDCRAVIRGHIQNLGLSQTMDSTAAPDDDDGDSLSPSC